eukprot:gb/GECG01010587.1/.p1 GENE.gb/GECG01010587.1/~~gb/GECG01010587.1/.p1  ORF type:complete len:444 (+),score=87.49 gb/GECG01010587.1/:1-1332(+)
MDDFVFDDENEALSPSRAASDTKTTKNKKGNKTNGTPVTPGAVRSRLRKFLDNLTPAQFQNIDVDKMKSKLEVDFDTNLDSHKDTIRETVKNYLKRQGQHTSPSSPRRSPYSPNRPSIHVTQQGKHASKRILHRTASKDSSSTVPYTDDDQLPSSQANLEASQDDYVKQEHKTSKQEPVSLAASASASDVVKIETEGDEEESAPFESTQKKPKTKASSSSSSKRKKESKTTESASSEKQATETGEKRPREAVTASSKQLASSLPLTVAPGVAKKTRTTMLVQVDCDKDLLDISGDVGSIGRMSTTDKGIILDLQGHRYAGTIVPSLAHMVVGITPKEAKVESVTNDFVQLEHLQNVLEDMKGTMTEGAEDIEELFRVEDVDAIEQHSDDDHNKPARASVSHDLDMEKQSSMESNGKRKQKKPSRPKQMIGKARKATNRKKAKK